MPADFCLRLAVGMLACPLVLSPARTARPAPGQKPPGPPHYFRPHFLVRLRLACWPLEPLYRLLAAVAVALVLRLGVEACALACWTGRHEPGNLEGDVLLWLPLRWLVGFVAPAVLCWLAYLTARIRSTQSATGILYV